MSEPSEDARVQRARRITSQALQETKIEERATGHLQGFSLFGRGNVYWQQVGDDIELVFTVRKWSGEKLDASLSLSGLAVNIASFFPDDAVAVKALVDTIQYIQSVILGLFPNVHNALMARAIKSIEKHFIPGQGRKMLEKFDAILKPSKSSTDLAMQQLRAEKTKRRGGSTPEIEVTDEQCATLSDNYPVLLVHWRNVRRWQKDNPSGNWRGYAKVDQLDTPDDLLDRVFDLDPYHRKPSAIAHEHAARRCGIPPNTYSLSNLSRLRSRGDKIRSQSNPMID
jgi:hypothetical protein